MLLLEDKGRYCIVAARIVIPGVGRRDSSQYKAVLLRESQLPVRFDYRGVCDIFSVSTEFDWIDGATSEFPKLENIVANLAKEIPDDVSEPEVIFIAVRPLENKIELRQWGRSADVQQIRNE